MAATFAGEFTGALLAGSQLVYAANGNANVSVAITKLVGGGPAVLYTDRTKSSVVSGSTVIVGAASQLTFFAEPGSYVATYTIGGNTYTGDCPVPDDGQEPIATSYPNGAALPGGSSNTVDPAPTTGTMAIRTDLNQQLAVYHAPSGLWLPVGAGATLAYSEITNGFSWSASGTVWSDVVNINIPVGLDYEFLLTATIVITQGTTAVGAPINAQFRIVDNAATSGNSGYTTLYAHDILLQDDFGATGASNQKGVKFTGHYRRQAQAAGSNTNVKLQVQTQTTTAGLTYLYSIDGASTSAPSLQVRTV